VSAALDPQGSAGGLLRIAALAAPAELVLQRGGEARLVPLHRPGWAELEWPPGEGLVHLSARPAGRVRLAREEGGEPVLRRLARPPEALWAAARILGRGAVLRLGTAPARPFAELRAGEAAAILLPGDWPAGAARLALLRGALPLAALRRHRAGLLLALRAGRPCEIVWEGIDPT